MRIYFEPFMFSLIPKIKRITKSYDRKDVVIHREVIIKNKMPLDDLRISPRFVGETLIIRWLGITIRLRNYKPTKYFHLYPSGYNILKD